MKILILGKNGQLGWELQRSLAILGEVIALDRQGSDGLSGNLSNLKGLEKTVLDLKPNVIVNAAAYTSVDEAESDTQLAQLVNSDAPALLAKLSKQLGILLVHYSTDYVFNGAGDMPWVEGQEVDPLSVYGSTKACGEQAIQSSGCEYLIFRTSWVFASKGNNFVKTMLRLASVRDSLNVITDQVGSPTSAELIADVTAHVIPKALNAVGRSGIYHLTASGEVSWYEYACYVIDQARNMGHSLQVVKVNPIPTSEYPTPAIRPLNSRLNCAKLRNTFDLHLPDWKVGVNRMLQEI